MRLTSIRILLMAAASFALALAACSDDGGGDGGDAGTDVSPDVSDVGDTGADTEPDAGICGERTPCARTADCIAAGLGDNAQCVQGCCEGTTQLPPCNAHLRECSSSSQGNDDFFCDTEAGLCLQRCDFDSASDTRSSDCPLNSYCLSELQNVPAGELNGACIPGDCDSNIFDAAACGGTGTCLPVGNGASYCISAGTAVLGDACNTSGATNPPASDVCAPGLLCFLNECIQPCNRRSGDSDCDAGVSCLGVFDTTPRNQPGWCGSACTAYSSGECEDAICGPVFGRFGINEWVCQSTGDDTLLGRGADCSRAGTRCGEGLICVTTNDAGDRVCLDMCEPTGADRSPGASCPPSEEGGELLVPETAWGEGSDYIALDAGPATLQVRAVTDGALLATVREDLVAGEVSTWVVSTSGGAPAVFSASDVAATDELPGTGLRFVHAAAGAGEVDLWLRSVIAELEHGAAWGGVFAVDEFRTILDQRFWETGGSYWITITPDDQTIETVALGSLAPGDAGIRVFHGVWGGPAVDVWIACPTGVTGFASCDGSTPAFTALDAGAFGGGTPAFASVAAAELSGASVFVVRAGADPSSFEASDVLAFGNLPTFVGGRRYQITAYQAGDTISLAVNDVFAPGEGEFAVTILALGETVDDVIVEEGPVEEALAWSETTHTGASAYIPVDPGAYAFTVELADGTMVRPELAELEEGDLVTQFAAESELSPEIFYTWDDFESPAAGSAAVRLVHAAPGVGLVVGTVPGEPDTVCTPSRLAGFGFCQEGCSPYPRRPGDYGCDEASSTCIPFVSRRDRPVEPLGYCDDDGGTAAAGEACSNDGFLGGDCADFAVCLDLEDDGSATCLPLCEPFAQGQCAAYRDFSTCSGIPPLVGQLNFSFCVDAQAGQIGDRCTNAGSPCAADNSICLDVGTGPVCLAVCRDGFDDCDAFGTDCETGGLNPEVVPAYMGLCR